LWTLGAGLASVLIPLPQTVVPAWTAVIVDEAGAPQAGVTVREAWEHYSLEKQSHQQEVRTDANGSVSFPRRILWRPYAVNLVQKIRKTAYSGPVAYLLAVREGAQGFADYCMKCPEPTRLRIVLHPTGRPQ
jgi:hypothetical protein